MSVKLSVLACAGLLAAASAQADVKLSTGFFYAKGQSNDLNVKDSTIKSVPLSLKIKEQGWGFRLGTSYLQLQNGTTEEGMGDTTASISYDLTAQPWVTFTVKEKFATGDKKKGLSTGYNDTKVQLDYFQTLGAGNSLFATAGYTFKGGKSDVPSYKDGAYGSIGLGTVLGQGWTAGISADYAEATSTNLKDVYGGSLFVGHRVNTAFSVNLFAGYDNTDTTSAGLGLSYKFK